MNREILFRAKKVDGGEWVEGYVVQRYGAWFIYDIKNADTCRQNGYLVDSDTICQYTGLTDKKGNPTSSEAIIAQSQTLILMAEQLNKSNGDALYRIGRMTLPSMFTIKICCKSTTSL